MTHCRQEEFLTRSVFQLMLPYIFVGGATKSTVRPGGGSKLNDALSIDPKSVSTTGFFTLDHFPTNASLYFCRSSNEIDSTSGGGVKME